MYSTLSSVPELVDHMVQKLGSNVNARDWKGRTTMHYAVAHGDHNIIKTLINLGAR